MFSISTLALGLSVLVLNTSALPTPDSLETRETTSSITDTTNAYDTSLKHGKIVPNDKIAFSSHSDNSVDVAHPLKKRDDAPNVSLVLSLLEGHGFEPESTSHTMGTKATATSSTKATTTPITKTTTFSTTKSTRTLTSATKAPLTLTAKATTVYTTEATKTTKASITRTTKTATTSTTKPTTTTKATHAADARDLS